MNSRALAELFTGLGKAIPAIAYQYNEDLATADKLKEEKRLKLKKEKRDDILADREDKQYNRGEEQYQAQISGAKKIKGALGELSNMPQEDAVAILDAAGPEGINKALESVTPPTPKPRSKDEIFQNFKSKIFGKESSNNENIGNHPQAANGLTAFGRAGIVLEKHIDKIGLDPKNPSDIQKVKSNPALYRELEDKVLLDNLEKAGWDERKAAAVHYAGPDGLTMLDTPAGDRKQKLADGREMPSVNEYANAFVGGGATVEGISSKGRQVLEEFISNPPKSPNSKRAKDMRQVVAKLHADLTPEELLASKGLLDEVSSLVQTEDTQADRRQQSFDKAMDRYLMGTINAAKMDEAYRIALLNKDTRDKAGTGRLSSEQRQSLSRMRLGLEKKLQAIDRFAADYGKLKEAKKEDYLKAHGEFIREAEKGAFGKLQDFLLTSTGRAATDPRYTIDTKKVGETRVKIQEEMNKIDEILAGLAQLPDEIPTDSTTTPPPATGKTDTSKYFVFPGQKKGN